MDTLLLRYNAHAGAVVVAATTKEFVRTSILPKLLCGEHGEKWFSEAYEYKFKFAYAFLNVNLGIGESKSDSISRRLRSTNPGSDDCLRLARRWLDACTELHGKRCQNVDMNFVPTRLIDVSPKLGRDAVKLVSLLEYDDLGNPTSVKYAALSYCWGTDPFLTTTSSNIRAMQQSISLSQLPQTIQDAIRITRYMGLRYLWVDSLCILQGTDTAAQQDWLSESWKMGQIYQSAYFTISAESAPAALAGILNERPAPSVDFCAIPKSEGDSDAIYLGQHQFSNPTITEPLHCRGWALQETTLSKRLLRFGTREVSWRCSHAEETETRSERQAYPPSNRSIDVEQMAEPTEQAREIYDGWQEIVEDYSGRMLSKKSDKLPAIAGLAGVAQKATGDAYVAGVWRQNASQGLLWMHQRGKQEYARKMEFQAPTWSWASVKGPVRFLQDYFQTTDLVVKFLSSKGRTTEGFHSHYQLSIKGSVLQLSTIRCHQFGSYYGGYDNFLPWGDLCSTLETYLDDLNDIPRRYRRGRKGDPKELVNSCFLFLAESGSLGAGLIILPVEMSHNRYRRIGMFKGFPLKDLGSKQSLRSERAWKLKNHLKRNNDQKKPQTQDVVLI